MKSQAGKPSQEPKMESLAWGGRPCLGSCGWEAKLGKHTLGSQAGKARVGEMNWKLGLGSQTRKVHAGEQVNTGGYIDRTHYVSPTKI